jgi:hypothetical protein
LESEQVATKLSQMLLQIVCSSQSVTDNRNTNYLSFTNYGK